MPKAKYLPVRQAEAFYSSLLEKPLPEHEALLYLFGFSNERYWDQPTIFVPLERLFSGFSHLSAGQIKAANSRNEHTKLYLKLPTLSKRLCKPLRREILIWTFTLIQTSYEKLNKTTRKNRTGDPHRQLSLH